MDLRAGELSRRPKRGLGALPQPTWNGAELRVSDKLALIDKIGRELQSRFGYAEIDAFLAEFDIKPPGNVGVNSKWVYSKLARKGISDQTILKIAEEL